MPSDGGFDSGLLSPVTASNDSLVDDRAFLDALIAAEVGLAGAYGDIGLADTADLQGIDEAFHTDRGRRMSDGIDPAELAVAAVVGGNPVIPLVRLLEDRVPEPAHSWIHRGATSQDILDSAMMLTAQRAVTQIRTSLAHAIEWMLRLAEQHRDTVAVARTLAQHAVPTTVGLRAATWARALRRARDRLEAAELPAQLGGAGGTLASFVEVTGSPDRARQLVAAYARRLALTEPVAPWHVTRWPITELGDALVQSIDAVGKFATDVATLSRPEIGEFSEGRGGGSSAMPQKRNPTEAVLIRSAAIRAPYLAATLHVAASLAADERPDGAWHAEWPALRELLRLALGASAHASSLAAHLRVDIVAALRNLAASDGSVVAERIALVLGASAAKQFVADVRAGEEPGSALRVAATDAGVRDVDLDALVDPSRYVGLAGYLVDTANDEPRSQEKR